MLQLGAKIQNRIDLNDCGSQSINMIEKKEQKKIETNLVRLIFNKKKTVRNLSRKKNETVPKFGKKKKPKVL